MKRALVAAAVALALAAAPAVAQERLVVTASRVADDLRGEYTIPHVAVTRRADYLFLRLTVFCDTRDGEQRREELRETLRDMLARAEADDDIELSRLVVVGADSYGREGDPIVVPFDEASIDRSFASNYGGRPDTNYVELVVKTPVRDDDSLATATGRISGFTSAIRGVGRSELNLSSEPSLSVVDPQNYRADIIVAMVEDAQSIVDELGFGYAVRFEGLENQIQWYRADVLDLAMFIPHRLVVEPADAE